MYDTRDEDNIHLPSEILSLNIWNLPDFPNPFSFSWFPYEGKEKEEGRKESRKEGREGRREGGRKEERKEGRKGEREGGIERKREREEGGREEERETPIINVKLYLSKDKVKHSCTSQLTGAAGDEAKD